MPELDASASVGPLQIAASVSAGLDRLSAHLRDIRQEVNALRARVPVDVRLFESGIIPTPTARGVLNLGGPQRGFYWIVRRLVVGGLTFKTTAAGTVEVYISAFATPQGSFTAAPNIVNALGMNDIVDDSDAMPYVVRYSSEQVVVQEGEHLLVLLDSATAGQQYVAACQVRQYRHVTAKNVFED